MFYSNEKMETFFKKLLVNEERQKASIHAVSKEREDFEKYKYIANTNKAKTPTRKGCVSLSLC